MKAWIAVIAAVCLSAGAANAAAYGKAGCGLGAVVMGPNGNQILAATTNATFWNQTFAITTGTLNCGQDGALTASREAEAFAEANYAALSRQMAEGKGEHLASFTTLAGCKADPAVFARARSAQGTIFASEDTSAAQVVENFRTAMRSDAATAPLCHG